jgi:spermidine synthase
MGKLLYYDGVLKGTPIGNAAASESFVHPLMLAHNLPRRVVIFGPGMGATIREVLKYKAVEKVIVIGSDEELMTFARNHFPNWCECSLSLDGSKSCWYDDPRVEIVYDQTPFEWISAYDGAALDAAFVDLL